MAATPTGTLTFLFTDLEGSTRLWEEHPEAMKDALSRHDEIVRASIDASGGRVFSTGGDGMAAAFRVATAAVDAALELQRNLQAETWGDTGPLRARVAVHAGEAHERDGDYFGPALNRTARLMAVAHGGQVVLTHTAEGLVRDRLPNGASLVDLGEHRLRDLVQAERVFQLAHADLISEFEPLRSLEAFSQNLPVHRTALIGRERQLERIVEALERHRLVTLIGVGGVGKTRLALQAAADVLDHYPDGAWLVPLAPVTDELLAPGAVAAALRIPERPGAPPTQSLVEALRSRRLLLVLDNCEHLLDGAALLADALLSACPGVSIIVTSREALGIEGEQILPTPSLALPARGSSATVEGAKDATAVELFCERARSVRPDFEVRPANVGPVVEICSRLDGIPLAIELAAARVNALSPADILARLDRRFALLTGGSRTALERHHTLRAAVDWSYDLLSESERLLFARLSVFSGGFTLESAEAVGAGSGVDEGDLLDLLASLVAKSIVIADDVGGSVRYRLLETLRQYGHDRLVESGEAEAMRTRHARHFVDASARFAGTFSTSEQNRAIALFDAEFENLRTAFDWLVEIRDASSVAHLLRDTPLLSFSGVPEAGRWHDRMQRFDAALAIADQLDPTERADLLAAAAWVSSQAGEHARAVTLAEQSLACARGAALDPPTLALQTLALVAFWANEPDRAIDLMERAIERSRLDGLASFVAFQSAQLGFFLGQAGHTDRAISVGEEALRLARIVGAPFLTSGAAFQLGLSLRPVDPDRALELLEEAHALIDLTATANAEWWLLAMAQIQAKLRRNADALLSCRAGLEACRRLGSRFSAPAMLVLAASVSLRLGRSEDAARLLGAAERMREEIGVPGGPADAASRDRTVARLRDALDPERFEAAWTVGRSLDFDDVIALLDN
jgi:predicted ATPase/class 3 adenylate cyclase